MGHGSSIGRARAPFLSLGSLFHRKGYMGWCQAPEAHLGVDGFTVSAQQQSLAI